MRTFTKIGLGSAVTLRTALIVTTALTPIMFGSRSAAAQSSWNTGSGNFNTPGSWTPSGVPGSSTDTTISTGAVTVTVTSTTGNSINSLITGPHDTLEIGGGTNFTIANGTGAGANAGTIQIDNNASLQINGGTVNNTGSITLNSVGNFTDLHLGDGTQLTGSGTITLTDNSNNRLLGVANSGAETVTNVNNTISGAGQFGAGNSIEFINQSGGTINASAATNALVVTPTGNSTLVTANGGGFVNQGLMEATNTGGLVLSGGEFNNTGGTIKAVGTGNNVYLENNTTIVGGTLNGSGGGFVETASGHNSTLSGVTIAGTFAAVNNSATTISGTITNNGTIALGSIGNFTQLQIAGGQTVTLNGGGAVTLTDNSNNFIQDAAAGTGKLINVDNTISGAGQLGNGRLAFDNQTHGVINANQLTNALILQSNAAGFTNEGLMEATSAGGLVVSGGSIVNAGGTISAIGTSVVGSNTVGNNVYLQNNTTIAGGRLSSSGGAVVESANGQTANLDGASHGTVTITGTYQVSNNSTTNLSGTITNNGTINLASVGNFTDLRFADGTQLTGGGTIALSDNSNNRFLGVVNSGAETVTNVNNTITGAGQFGASNSIEFINQSGGTINANGTNSLVITPTTNSTLIAANGGAFVNQGLMEATNTGGLVLNSGLYNNTGTIKAVGTGNNVYLQNNATIAGGTISGSNGGIVESANGQAGHLIGVTITGAYQVTNNSTTTLSGTITNQGTITVNGAGNFTDLTFADGTTLTGGGSIVLSDNPNNRLFGLQNSGAETVTNLNNTISGAGQFGASNSVEFINKATVNANGTNALIITPTTNSTVVTANGGGFVNQGTLEATNTGGLVLNSGQFNNATGTIKAVGAGNNVYLQNNVTVSGGTLTTTGGGVIETVSGHAAHLDGVSQGGITLNGTYQVTNNSTTTLSGVFTNNGTVNVSSTGNNTDFTVADGTTFTGGGTIVLSDNGNNRFFGVQNSGAETVTNFNNTISGAGQFGVSNSFEFINQSGGTINANGTNALIVAPTTNGTVVTANGGGFVNQGLMEATNTGGLVLAGGEFNNAGGTIKAVGTGNNVYLQNNTTVVGGTLNGSGGGIVETVNGQTANLSGVTIAGTYQASNNSTTNISGTITNHGTINVSSVGNSTDFKIADGTTLTGGGNIVLSDNGNNRVYGIANSGAETLTNVDNTISGAGQIGISNSFRLVNGGTVDATGSNALFLAPTTNGSLPNGLLNEAGGVLEGSGSGGLKITQGAVSNLGTVLAADGSNVTYSAGVTNQNFSGGTLTGGTWQAVSTGDGATLAATGGPVTTNAATIILDGAGSSITFGGATVESSLTTNQGTLSVLSNRNYTTSNDITNSSTGTINLGGGTFTANSLTNAGALVGFGTVTPSGGAQINNNNGSITANGGTLALTTGVSGNAASHITINSGAALNLSGATTGSTVGTLAQNGTNLNLGGHSITVSTDYNNASFGTGNSFNNHGNVTGTGLILASGNTAMTVTGADITGTTLNLGNFHTGVAQTTSFNVNNTGTTGPSLRGAVQNTGITASGLSVTAQNFGPIALGGSVSEQLSYTGATGGTLTGQSLRVVSNFDNVAPVTVAVQGTAWNLAQGQINNGTVGSPIALGNFHVNDTVTQQGVSISNVAPSTFSEGLTASVTGTTGGVQTNGGGISAATPLSVAGSPNSSAIKVGIDTSSAGNKSGTATITFGSSGTGTSGLGTTNNVGTGTVNVTGGVYNLASSNTIAPVHIVAHVGDGGGSVSSALSITNTAPTGLFSEGLDSSFGTYTANVGNTLTPTFAGSITNLAAGSTNNTAMTVSLNTATAGAFGGSVVVHQASDGATTSHLGTTALADQSVALTGSITGGVFVFAAPTVNTTQPIDFGSVRINTAVASQAISISNTATGPTGFVEALNGSVAATPTGFTAGGSFTGLTNTASPSTAISVGLNTAAGGAKSGNVALQFVSDGTAVAGDGTMTTLTPNTNVAVTGNVYRLASPTVNTPSVTLAARVGNAAPSQAISITNTSADAFTENLKASLGTASTGFTTAGGTQVVAAQGTNTGLSVALNTSTSGTLTGSVGVSFASSGVAGEQNAANDIALTSGSVALTGKVYQTASATATPALTFGTVHVGDTVAAKSITVTNTASGALTDVVTGNISTVTGPFTNGGGTLGSGVAVGAPSTALTVGLNTTAAGVFSGAATLNFASHNADLVDVALIGGNPGPVALTGTVNNYAAIGIANATRGTLTGQGNAYTLNLGTLTRSSGAITAAFDALNAALGPADALSISSFDILSGAGDFGITQNDVSDLAAGQSAGDAFEITFDPTADGSFSEEIRLIGTGSNDSGWDSGDGVLDPILTIEGTVTDGGNTSVPEPASWLLLAASLGGLGSLRRFGRRERK